MMENPSSDGCSPKAPPSSLNAQRVAWGVPSQSRLSGPLSPKGVVNARHSSNLSGKALEGGGGRHGRVVGMHVMGWTSDLTSKHGTHGKGMEERDT